MNSTMLPRYDRAQSYAWNYEHAPAPVAVEVPAIPGEWSYCGRPVGSPLGLPAGPLLNGRWCLYYASLGFDVLTYKTVRSYERPCYPLPNLQPVRCEQLAGGEERLPAINHDAPSWAVSFGMPSMSPETWRSDVAWTRKQLGPGKVLAVSVVGSVQPDWTLDRLAEDYAQCAAWAVEAGADVIETNFSCPNVATCDGQLYQQPADAARVAARLRAAIGRTPLVVKIGHVHHEHEAEVLLEALAPSIDGLAMTNSVAATIAASDGQLMFEGQKRGICGEATRTASLRQTALFARLRERQGLKLSLVGVGGASTARHVRHYLDAGAESVHLATAAMLNPGVALEIRREWK